MGTNETRAWWLPIVLERVRRATIDRARIIIEHHGGLGNLNSFELEKLSILINQGKIDGALFHNLVTSPHPAEAIANIIEADARQSLHYPAGNSSIHQPVGNISETAAAQNRLDSISGNSIHQSIVSKPEIDTTQNLSNPSDDATIYQSVMSAPEPDAARNISSPTTDSNTHQSMVNTTATDAAWVLPNLTDDSTHDQSSLDALKAGPSKKNLKNQRRKEKKRAKRATATVELALSSVPPDTTIANPDTPAASSESDKVLMVPDLPYGLASDPLTNYADDVPHLMASTVPANFVEDRLGNLKIDLPINSASTLSDDSTLHTDDRLGNSTTMHLTASTSHIPSDLNVSTSINPATDIPEDLAFSLPLDSSTHLTDESTIALANNHPGGLATTLTTVSVNNEVNDLAIPSIISARTQFTDSVNDRISDLTVILPIDSATDLSHHSTAIQSISSVSDRLSNLTIALPTDPTTNLSNSSNIRLPIESAALIPGNSIIDLATGSLTDISDNPIAHSIDSSIAQSTNEELQKGIQNTGEESVASSAEEFTSDSSEEFTDRSSEGETTDGDAENALTLSSTEPVSGVMGLKWAYATHTLADNILLSHGIWLFEKVVDHFCWQPYVWRSYGLGIEQAPVVIDTLGDTINVPTAEFDGQVLYINTHTQPWTDLRAEFTHPDMLPATRLVEYQATESMGLNVWRHDRNLLDCRLLSCRTKVADHNPATVICLGCGPKTIIRYCSVAHMVADLQEHWRECGHRDLVLRRVVDHTTAPARFARICPAIRDSQGVKSYALYRQGAHAMLNYGRYTLFDFVTEEPTVLVWTKEDPRGEEMERRVERLLNFALFDQRNKVMVGFLYRLLRQCLQLKHSWSVGTSYALKKQFWEEFGLDASRVEEDLVCECEWVGKGLAAALHLPACRGLWRRFGREFHESGMGGYLAMYEARYWILRAWQQQHAAAGHWSDRVKGEGFGGEVEGTSPELGPGWVGWGAGEDDVVV